VSGFPRIACRGAPRDLGFDQGRACAAQIAQLVAARTGGPLARGLAALRPRRAARETQRDTLRFFPHMAERSAGLARGAGVSPLALAELSALPEAAPADALRIVAGARGPGIARALPREALVVLRESAPDTDYRSLELVASERIAPFLGVNERGLAVAAALLGGPGGGCAAPASLLAQDCLQRFDRVDKALEWLERRPAGGRALFLLADATGAAAGFEVDGDARQRSAPRALPLSGSTAERSCIAVASPGACALAWTFADGATGEAELSAPPAGERATFVAPVSP
jgi:hypothetical protein